MHHDQHNQHNQHAAARNGRLTEAAGAAPMAGHEHQASGGHDAHPAGHDKHAGHSVAMFRDKFWLSLALTIPVVLLSHDIQEWVGYSIPMLPGIEYLPAILSTIIFLYGGLVFIRGAAGELRDRQPGMMTLISLAITVAFVTSWAGTLGLFDVEIWWELATLITIMLLGHWLEMRALGQAQGALAALAALLPDEAERVTDDGSRPCPSPAWPLVTSCWSVLGGGCRQTARSSKARSSSTSPWSPASPAPSPGSRGTG